MPRRPDPRSLAAAASFRARLTAEGAVLLEPEWLGSNTPHRIRCKQGHETTPRPHNIESGQGICKLCADQVHRTRWADFIAARTSSAEAAFHARLAELGATLLEPGYLGSLTPHRVRCSEGHEGTPTPHHIAQGHGLGCRCDYPKLDIVKARFLTLLAEQGAVLLESEWQGTRLPHRVRCAAGHECAPRPFCVLQGGGICRKCAGLVWDAFYVVAAVTLHRIKFGVTSGDPEGRLRVHRRAGYRDTIRLLTGLPGSAAPDLERATISTLRLAGARAVQGREYYDAAALAIVLDVVDNHPLDLRHAA